MIMWELFITFFKIGLFTFGGGYAMIPLIKEEVIGHGWLTEKLILDFIGISESTPGPIAVNLATFVGSSQGGFLGAMCATIGVVLPSFIIILIIAAVFKNFSKNKYVAMIMKGIKPVILGLI
ncbi:MAG: chromate transporter, partial [Clostridia bacterium]